MDKKTCEGCAGIRRWVLKPDADALPTQFPAPPPQTPRIQTAAPVFTCDNAL